MENHFRFLYLRDSIKSTRTDLTNKTVTSRGFPVACIAIRIDRNSNTIYYGVSTVHPKDKNADYDRALARELAVGRLILTKKTVQYQGFKYNSLHDLMRLLVTHLISDKSLPKQTRKALMNWVKDDNAMDKKFSSNLELDDDTFDYPLTNGAFASLS